METSQTEWERADETHIQMSQDGVTQKGESAELRESMFRTFTMLKPFYKEKNCARGRTK